MLKIFVRFVVLSVALSFCLSPVYAQEKIDNEEAARELLKAYPPVPLSKLVPNRSLPHYFHPAYAVGTAVELPKQLDLTEYLGVKGPERDQGNCGSCWVWSGIGCLEASFNKALKEGQFPGVNYVENQKFSINFVEGKARKYPELFEGNATICDGGSADLFVDLLSTDDGLNFLVPRANYNADATFSGNIGDTDGARDLEMIQLNPHVTLDKLELENVVSDYNDKEKTKLEVMQALNDGYLVQMDFLVYFDFYIYWQRFDSLEDGQYRFVNKEEDGAWGGHAVLIVGYDTSDPDPSKHYWIAQNSWGYDYAHPDGLFKVNIESTFGANRVLEYLIYKPTFKVDSERCDNVDNDCNTVTDDGCSDQCIDNDKKTVPGACGCDKGDLDTDFDGVLDCFDGCPDDPNKVNPGLCGCGVEDNGENIADDNGNGVLNCQENVFARFKDIKFGYLNRQATNYCFNEDSHRFLDFQVNYLCAQTELNELYCLGDNKWGQLGDGTKESHNYFTKVEGLRNVSSFDIGRNHGCAVADSKVYCWGWNFSGEAGKDNGYGINEPWACNEEGACGYDENTFSLTPSEIDYNIEQPNHVTCGFGSTCVSTAIGKTYCFGENRGGMFGVKGWLFPHRQWTIDYLNNGSWCVPDRDDWKDLSGTYFYNGFMATVPLENISEMAMSYQETAAISDGVLYNYGIHHDLKTYPIAARYDEFKDLVSVSKSETDLCAVNAFGELYCLDTFIESHLGNLTCKIPGDPRSDYPVQKVPLENVSMVGCGSNVLLMSFGDGEESDHANEVYSLACNFYDEKDAIEKTVIYAGNLSVDYESHICAVSNGDLYCWGRGNTYGQLGSSRTEDLDIPTKVEGVSDVTSLAVTGGANCYISDGEVYCFGDLIQFGIDRQSSEPCRLTMPNVRVSDFIHAGDACEYLGGTCGRYSYRNGNYICKPCSEAVEYEVNNEIVNCLDDQSKLEDDTDQPAPRICPSRIPLEIVSVKSKHKKFNVAMKPVDSKCFKGNYVYQVRVKNKGRKNIYKIKDPSFVLRNLEKGTYVVSYRVMKQDKKKIKVNGKTKYKRVLKPVTGFSKAVKIKILGR